MATKSISKSIRISEEVYGYIMKEAGNGFNEKFENIILVAKKEEPIRRKVLADLQRSIEEKRRELYSLSGQFVKLRDFYRLILEMYHELSEYRDSLLTDLEGEQQ